MSLGYFVTDSEKVPFAPIIVGSVYLFKVFNFFILFYFLGVI